MDFDRLQKLYEVDEDSLFEQGILVFDASALLDLYFYSEETAIDILDKSHYYFGSSRMFLPSQVKFEFEKNRLKTVLKPSDSYNGILNSKHNYGYYPKIIKEVDKFLEMVEKLNGKISGYVKTFKESFENRNKHPYLSKEVIDSLNLMGQDFLKSIPRENLFTNLEEQIQQEINERKLEFQNKLDNDVILGKLNDYFRIGREYSYAELLEISRLGEIRYNSKIPPGYMDKSEKVGFQVYGDLIIWQQLLEYAQECKLPCIFVSNDTKEDWNEFQETDEGRMSKKTDSRKPRAELLFEFDEKVNKDFKKLTLKDFIFKLDDKLEEKFGASTLEEIKLEHLNELILEEEDNFINTIQSEIIIEAKSGIIEPDEAFEYDIDNEDIYISFSSVVLPSDSSETTVIYEVEVTIICEMLFWEYWGRDDDTKEIFLSPVGTASWSGTKEFKIYREIEVDFKSDIIKTISYDIALAVDDVSYEQESWGDREDRGLYY